MERFKVEVTMSRTHLDTITALTCLLSEAHVCQLLLSTVSSPLQNLLNSNHFATKTLLYASLRSRVCTTTNCPLNQMRKTYESVLVVVAYARQAFVV